MPFPYTFPFLFDDYAGIKTADDSGSGSDAISTLALTLFDSGIGSESLPSRHVMVFESAIGAIDSGSLAVTQEGSDSGSGVELSLKALYLLRADAGAGADSATLQALFGLVDNGSGVESLALQVGLALTEAGVGLDAVLAFLRLLSDSGIGYDDCLLIGVVGRLLAVAVYTRPYRDLKVYTRPYRDLKVTTREGASW